MGFRPSRSDAYVRVRCTQGNNLFIKYRVFRCAYPCFIAYIFPQRVCANQNGHRVLCIAFSCLIHTKTFSVVLLHVRACVPLASLEVLSHGFSSRRPLGTSINPLLFMDLGRYFHAPTGRSSFSPFYLFFTV